MIGKCENCGQVKNLTKGLCNNCYHRKCYRRKAKAKREKAIVCVKCGTLLRNKDYNLCKYCRTEKTNMENRLQGLLKKIEATEGHIELCKLVQQGAKLQQLGDERGKTKQAIFNIVNKGVEYYKKRLEEYKATFCEIAKKVKEFNKFEN